MTIEGGCLCGKVRYEIDGELTGAGNCHCSMCRRAHGAAFGTYAGFGDATFTWVSGEEFVKTYSSSTEGGRCFCTECGSTLGAVANDKIGWITLGTVDGDPGVVPQAHIFVTSKAPWHDITDDLPQFEAYPPSS